MATLVTMGTHVYSFGERLFIQRSGGPIGVRSTASLASVVMKYFDKKWSQMMLDEGLIVDNYSRYVDDCRMILASINPGWRWTEKGFQYAEVWETEDKSGGETAQQITARELTKSMSFLTEYLNFTMEESGMRNPKL